MEDKTIRMLDIKDFKHLDMVDYADEDILVSRSWCVVHDYKGMVRVNFFFIISCIEGYIQFDMNGKTYSLQKNDIVICLPTMVMSHVMTSLDNKIRIIGFSTSFLRRVVKNERDTSRMMSYVLKNPIQHISEQNRLSAAHLYGDLIIEKIKEVSRYKKDILHYLFAALFCELMDRVYFGYVEADLSEPESDIKRASVVFKQFMEILMKDSGKHRSVSYYADILCYSPKYVSQIVKQSSGRTAREWIDESAIEQIKYQLKFSERSIKEIAEDFRFPNLSFFGKYVKRHLGVSPTRYRDMPDDSHKEQEL